MHFRGMRLTLWASWDLFLIDSRQLPKLCNVVELVHPPLPQKFYLLWPYQEGHRLYPLSATTPPRLLTLCASWDLFLMDSRQLPKLSNVVELAPRYHPPGLLTLCASWDLFLMDSRQLPKLCNVVELGLYPVVSATLTVWFTSALARSKREVTSTLPDSTA